MKEMYNGVVNSPETTITNDISSTDTLIYVLDDSRVPDDLPNLMTIGTGTNAETVKVVSKDGSAITVIRGFQGIAKSWHSGSIIARNFTEYDYNALIENIDTLREDTDTNADDILDLISYIGDLESLDTDEKANIVLALNEIYQDLVAHKAENASQHGDLTILKTSQKSSLVEAINELFTNVSDGKTLIATAITDMGQSASGSDTFATLANSIRAIETGDYSVGDILNSSKYLIAPEVWQFSGHTGQGGGLAGWNCRHSFYPFDKEIDERIYSDDDLRKMKAEENKTTVS